MALAAPASMNKVSGCAWRFWRRVTVCATVAIAIVWPFAAAALKANGRGSLEHDLGIYVVQVAGAWAQLVASTMSACAPDAAAAKALAGGLRVLEESNLSEYAVTWFLDSASAAVASDIAPKFWAYFDGFEGVKGSKGVAAWASARVSAALLFLSQALDAQLQVARAIESSSAESDRHYDVVSRCRANLAAVVFRPVPLYFHEILYLFLSKEFADFVRKTASDRADDEERDDDESDDEAQGDDSMVIEGEDDGTHETSNFRQVCLSINHVGALPMAEEVCMKFSNLAI